MKHLLLVTLIICSIFFGKWAFDKFQVQQNEYLSSSQCIKSYTDDGYERNSIEINGSTCSLK